MKVGPDNSQQRFLENTLTNPTAFEFGPEDEVYLANQGLIARQGEILRFDRAKSVPEPTAVMGLVAIALGGATARVLRHPRDP